MQRKSFFRKCFYTENNTNTFRQKFLCYALFTNGYKYTHISQRVAKFNMDATELLSADFMFQILTSETIAWEANSLSSPVITRNHRKLRGSTFSSFHSISLALCGLRCQRHPRCVSTNFRKVSVVKQEERVCELNDRGVKLPVEGNDDLEYEEGAVYMQLPDIRVSKNKTMQFLTREE